MWPWPTASNTWGLIHSSKVSNLISCNSLQEIRLLTFQTGFSTNLDFRSVEMSSSLAVYILVILSSFHQLTVVTFQPVASLFAVFAVTFQPAFMETSCDRLLPSWKKNNPKHSKQDIKTSIRTTDRSKSEGLFTNIWLKKKTLVQTGDSFSFWPLRQWSDQDPGSSMTLQIRRVTFYKIEATSSNSSTDLVYSCVAIPTCIW